MINWTSLKVRTSGSITKIKSVKKRAVDGETVFVVSIANERLLPRVCKISNLKTVQFFQKIEDLSRYFLKKESSASLFIKEMQCKTIEQLELYIAGGWDLKWYSPFRKLFGLSTKIKPTVYHMIQQFHSCTDTKQKWVPVFTKKHV